jgi:hypothetical protein
MLKEKNRPLPLALFEDFEQDDAGPEPVDGFRTQLIVAYEHALEEGVNPIAALSVMLDWASQEMRRYSAG